MTSTAARPRPDTGTASEAPRGRVRRLRMEILGAVQGVGFRPFVYRLARELGLAGWVINDARGVFLEVEGPERPLRRFRARLPAEIPPRSEIHHLDSAWLRPVGFDRFEIRHSAAAGSKRAVVLADVATCPACLAEIRDPTDRRHRYPFTNCTDCGPRASIVRALPYDRPQTTMAGFRMCPACRREYEDPLDRRFHAQPNACPECGPHLELWDAAGAPLAHRDEALRRTVTALGQGRIVALKGLGGFHLVVDAGHRTAVAELRRRKGRPDKPLALMVPDLDWARRLCTVDAAAAELLASPEAPIVLLPRRPDTERWVSDGVAPGQPELGIMLPYTPLHHLLLEAAGRPLVATSGNLSEEPIVTDEVVALERLGGIADRFLVHDRPIARHVDDSVLRPLAGAATPLRRARGYAPLPLPLGREVPTLLALGGHLKNVVGLGLGDRAFLSQHLGDMENAETFAAFERAVADFLDLWEAEPVAVAHDLHPDYPTTLWAERATAPDGGPLAGLPRVAVQHHHAHLASCLADRGATGPALGFVWDGTGYGPDGTIWGGEVLLGDAAGYQRLARLRPFRLPGGDAAVREPRRSALALLHATYGAQRMPAALVDRLCAPAERRLLERMLATGTNAPPTTSAGRLFDGVAALAGLHPRVSFEGQAAMALETAADGRLGTPYPLPLIAPADGPAELDWRPLVTAVVTDVTRGAGAAAVAARFHAALVTAMVAVADRLAGGRPVALSGGCFQNKLLVETARDRLTAHGFHVLLHRRVPPNDGGLALGQIAVAAARTAAP